MIVHTYLGQTICIRTRGSIGFSWQSLCAKILWSQLVLQFPHGWTTKIQHHQSILLIKQEKICLYLLPIRMVHFGVSPNQNGSSWVVFLHLVEQFCVYSTGIPRCMRTTTIYRMYYFYIVHTNSRHYYFCAQNSSSNSWSGG